MDYSLPGSFLHEILQARILVYVVIPFSRESSCPRDQTWVSCIAGRLFTIWATREAHERETLHVGLGEKMVALWYKRYQNPQLGEMPNLHQTETWTRKFVLF